MGLYAGAKRVHGSILLQGTLKALRPSVCAGPECYMFKHSSVLVVGKVNEPSDEEQRQDAPYSNAQHMSMQCSKLKRTEQELNR